MRHRSAVDFFVAHRRFSISPPRLCCGTLMPAILVAGVAVVTAQTSQPPPAQGSPLPPLQLPKVPSPAEASLLPQGGDLDSISLQVPLLPDPGAPSPPLPGPFEIQPVLPPLSPVFGASELFSADFKMFVKGFRFKGGTVFSEKALNRTVEKYTQREVSGLELEQARQDLTLQYVNAGYINSGAVLEEQDTKDGYVNITLVEGRLTEINVSGNGWLRSWWLRNALRRSAGKPLNVKTLKQGVELLRQNPVIGQINAELKPGSKPGESILEAPVKENQPFQLGTEVSNRRPPSVGSEIVDVTASTVTLTGNNDPLTLRYGLGHAVSETPDHWNWGDSDNLDGSYQFPVSPWSTTLALHASRNNASVVEEAFRPLNIYSVATDYGVTLRQPFYETLNDVFAVSIGVDYRQNQSFLLGRLFSLSPGAIEGETKDFVVPLSIEYVNRTQEQVLALRSTFTLGVDAFGATVARHDTVNGTTTVGQSKLKAPDGVFFAWLGQAQYVRRLFGTDNLAVFRLNALLSNDPLLSLDQFSIGGSQSVRGYRENELLRDNGVFGSVEVHVPVLSNKDKSAKLTLAPFFDIGGGWNNVEYLGPPPQAGADKQADLLASVGVGLIYTPCKHVTAQLFWGYALNRDFLVKDGKNLQDYGLHFTLTVAAF